jgi:nitroreductase
MTHDQTYRELAELMRAQAAGRRLLSDPIDDATVLSLLELAGHATSDRRRRCEFVVVRDPDIRHQLARTYRQGWSIYKRVLRTRSHDDAVLEARQWESDHFEDVPVLVVACVHGRRPLFPAAIAAAFYASVFPAVQNLLLAAGAHGLGASATTLPLWSAWEARRTLGLPSRVTPVAVVAPDGHGAAPRLSRSRPSATSSTSTALGTSRFGLGHARGGRTRHNGGHDFEAGDDVPRKGRARRFREARKLKQGYDDGLFREGSGTLADVGDDEKSDDDDDEFDDEFEDEEEDWDPDHHLNDR